MIRGHVINKMSNKYSYSKINLYEDCPFKYKLQYVDGNYVYIGSIATEFGTAIHECEEAIAKCIQSNMPINYVQIKNDFILKCIDLQIKYPNDFYTEDNKSSRNYKDTCFNELKRYQSEIVSNANNVNIKYLVDGLKTVRGEIGFFIRDKALPLLMDHGIFHIDEDTFYTQYLNTDQFEDIINKIISLIYKLID